MMSEQSEHASCHIKTCPGVAIEVCERCSHAYCATHIRHITIMHRDEPLRSHMEALNRLPTHVETYALCLRCSTKPIQRRVSLDT